MSCAADGIGYLFRNLLPVCIATNGTLEAKVREQKKRKVMQKKRQFDRHISSSKQTCPQIFNKTAIFSIYNHDGQGNPIHSFILMVKPCNIIIYVSYS